MLNSHILEVQQIQDYQQGCVVIDVVIKNLQMDKEIISHHLIYYNMMIVK